MVILIILSSQFLAVRLLVRFILQMYEFFVFLL